jgi:hypothetical protein
MVMVIRNGTTERVVTILANTPAFVIISGVVKSERLGLSSYVGDLGGKRITFKVLIGKH